MAPALSKPQPPLGELFEHAYKTIRNSDRTTKDFAGYLKWNSDSSLAARSVAALEQGLYRFLSQHPRDWKLEDLRKLAASPDPKISKRRGIYLLIAGEHVYARSSRTLPKRFETHTEEFTRGLNGEDYMKTVFYKHCVEDVQERPLHVHVATDSWRRLPDSDAEDHAFFLELLETAVIIVLGLLPFNAFDKPKQRNVAQAARQPLLKQFTPDWTGSNACLPCCVVSIETQARWATLSHPCRHCNLDISDHGMVHHLIDVHDDHDPPYNCPICDRAMIKKSLAAHLERHDPELAHPYRCEIQDCDASFPSVRGLNKHAKTHSADALPHPDYSDLPFVCGECDSRFKYKSALEQHMIWHRDDEPFECDQCDETFRTPYGLKDHAIVHATERPFKCDQCPTTTKRKGDLEKHKKNFHPTNDAKFTCPICGVEKPYKHLLTSHMYTHSTEMPFSCQHDGCARSFKRNWEMTSHQKDRHGHKCANAGCGTVHAAAPGDEELESLTPAQRESDHKELVASTISANALDDKERERITVARLQDSDDEMLASHAGTDSAIPADAFDSQAPQGTNVDPSEAIGDEMVIVAHKRRRITRIVTDSDDDDYETASPKHDRPLSTLQCNTAASAGRIDLEEGNEKSMIMAPVSGKENGPPKISNLWSPAFYPQPSNALTISATHAPAVNVVENPLGGGLKIPTRKKIKPYECNRCLKIVGYRRKSDFENHMRNKHRRSPAEIAELVRKNEEENKD